MEDSIKIIEEVDSRTQRVRTRSLDISFNELLDMFQNEELVIQPEYQRLFRWPVQNRSRFIETLVLEMPIPPVFVIELDDNVYELIDGLQRISSYLHFVGAHPRFQGEDRYLELEGCDIATSLNGLTYEKLPRALAIKLKRAFVRVEVLRKESDKRLRYYMFKRLNTGGEQLKEQEIRNCSMRLLAKGEDFIKFLGDMVRDENFQSCIRPLNDERREQMYEQELVLRFLAFKNDRAKFKKSIEEFLDGFMEAVSDPDTSKATFDYVQEAEIFKRTMSILAKSVGESSFSGAEKHWDFKVYHYEAFTLGLQKKLSALRPEDPEMMGKLRAKLLALKQDKGFLDVVKGGGLNDRGPLKRRIEFVEQVVDEIV